MRSQYKENLRRVNDSIVDAQAAVNESPNDPEARRAADGCLPPENPCCLTMAMDQPMQ